MVDCLYRLHVDMHDEERWLRTINDVRLSMDLLHPADAAMYRALVTYSNGEERKKKNNAFNSLEFIATNFNTSVLAMMKEGFFTALCKLSRQRKLLLFEAFTQMAEGKKLAGQDVFDLAEAFYCKTWLTQDDREALTQLSQVRDDDDDDDDD